MVCSRDVMDDTHCKMYGNFTVLEAIFCPFVFYLSLTGKACMWVPFLLDGILMTPEPITWLVIAFLCLSIVTAMAVLLFVLYVLRFFSYHLFFSANCLLSFPPVISHI